MLYKMFRINNIKFHRILPKGHKSVSILIIYSPSLEKQHPLKQSNCEASLNHVGRPNKMQNRLFTIYSACILHKHLLMKEETTVFYNSRTADMCQFSHEQVLDRMPSHMSGWPSPRVSCKRLVYFNE